MRRGVGGFRVAKHLHLLVAHDKQAETAGRERDDAHVGERTERFWDGLIRRRVVLLATAGELDVAVDRDDATDSTQSEAVGCIRRFPLLGYGKLSFPGCQPVQPDRLRSAPGMAAVVSQTRLKIAVADGPNQWRETVRHRVVVVWRVGDEHGKRCCGMPAPFDRYGTVHAGRTNEHTGLNIRHLGYGMLLKMDFHDSTCDSNFRTNEQIDCPIRCNRYLDRTLQV